MLPSAYLPVSLIYGRIEGKPNLSAMMLLCEVPICGAGAEAPFGLKGAPHSPCTDTYIPGRCLGHVGLGVVRLRILGSTIV